MTYNYNPNTGLTKPKTFKQKLCKYWDGHQWVNDDETKPATHGHYEFPNPGTYCERCYYRPFKVAPAEDNEWMQYGIE
jgi:hypothetical protein